MNSKKCKCGINISFVRTKSGKAMPVESDQEFTIITKNGEVTKGYIPHWQNCPYAKNFRSQK